MLINHVQKLSFHFRSYTKKIVFQFFISNFAINFLILVFQHLSFDIQSGNSKNEKHRWLGFLIQMKAHSHSQLAQDLWVLFRTSSKRMGYFVEVGSCHPMNLNNTFLLENSYAWSGLLIEPNPHMVKLLLDHRTSKVLDFAIAEGSFIELHLAENPEFTATKQQLISRTHKLHRSTGEVINVKSSGLSELLDRADCPKNFDFLSLDIEGGELFALHSLDLERHRPLLIAVEHNFSPSRKDIEDYLLKNGYVLDPLSLTSSWDDWYIDKAYLEKIDSDFNI